MISGFTSLAKWLIVLAVSSVLATLRYGRDSGRRLGRTAAMFAALAMIRRTLTISSLEPILEPFSSSNDGGQTWSRFAHLGSGDDYVLDHIAIDPRIRNTSYVAAWSVENQQAGDFFRSHDGGKNLGSFAGNARQVNSRDGYCWLRIHRLSSRARWMAFTAAPTAATPGRKFLPASQNEIKNIESIAVDPKNPNVVYAGTWHLAWKTDDGGANWHHINKGMIDDSDVFSIIVDLDQSFGGFCQRLLGNL